VTLTEHRVTSAGRLWGATRRVGAIFRSSALPLAYVQQVHSARGAWSCKKMVAVAGVSIVLTGYGTEKFSLPVGLNGKNNNSSNAESRTIKRP